MLTGFPAGCRYHALVSLQVLAAKLAGSGGGAADAEAARPLFEVLIRTPPTPAREEFQGGLKSWSGAAEVRCEQ